MMTRIMFLFPALISIAHAQVPAKKPAKHTVTKQETTKSTAPGASTSTPTPTPDPAEAWKNCTHYLTCAKTLAEADLARQKQALAEEAKKFSDYDVCRVDLLKFQRDYDNWFIQHYDQFLQLDHLIDQQMDLATRKLQQLKNEVIEIVPEKDQTVQKVTFQQMIEYFRNLNARIKSCPKDKFQALMAQQNDPSLNPFQVGHDQVLTAIQRWTANINASLISDGHTYSISFVPTDAGYQLEFQVRFAVNGRIQRFDFSLLGSSTTAMIGEEQKWYALVKNGVKVDNESVDGIERYFSFESRRDKSCDTSIGQNFRVGRPFALLEDVSKSDQLPHVPPITLTPVSNLQVNVLDVMIEDSGKVNAIGADGNLYQADPFKDGMDATWTRIEHPVSTDPKKVVLLSHFIPGNGTVDAYVTSDGVYQHTPSEGWTKLSTLNPSGESNYFLMGGVVKARTNDYYGGQYRYEDGRWYKTCGLDDGGPIKRVFFNDGTYVYVETSLYYSPTSNIYRLEPGKKNFTQVASIDTASIPCTSTFYFDEHTASCTNGSQLYRRNGNKWEVIAEGTPDKQKLGRVFSNRKGNTCVITESAKLFCLED